MFPFFVQSGTVTQRRYGSEDAENKKKERMFADSATQYAGCALPFAGVAVFVAVAMCLVDSLL
jgi:hypothetical protein